MRKKCKENIFNLAYDGWNDLKNRVGQGCIFHIIIPAHYTFYWKFC